MSLFATRAWPDDIDVAVITGYLLCVLLLPLLGYIVIALDIRAYLRSLRRALVVVSQPFYDIPKWARHKTPQPFARLGLTASCTKDELLEAYRVQVKALHPDHGGDRRQFLQMQKNFEQALRLVEDGE